jgi:hypothetical protein
MDRDVNHLARVAPNDATIGRLLQGCTAAGGRLAEVRVLGRPVGFGSAIWPSRPCCQRRRMFLPTLRQRSGSLRQNGSPHWSARSSLRTSRHDELRRYGKKSPISQARLSQGRHQSALAGAACYCEHSLPVVQSTKVELIIQSENRQRGRPHRAADATRTC